MKIIFIEDVPNVAEVGEVKEVADGYGRNFLLPHKLAVLANSQASHIVEAKLKAKAQREAQLADEMSKVAKQLEGKEITLKARVGDKDRLYGSITSADIAGELSKATGIEIDKRKVELDEPIRELGSYEIVVKLFRDITPKVKLTVVAEVAETEKKAEEEKEKEKGKKPTKAKKKKETEPVVEEEAAGEEKE